MAASAVCSAVFEYICISGHQTSPNKREFPPLGYFRSLAGELVRPINSNLRKRTPLALIQSIKESFPADSNCQSLCLNKAEMHLQHLTFVDEIGHAYAAFRELNLD